MQLLDQGRPVDAVRLTLLSSVTAPAEKSPLQNPGNIMKSLHPEGNIDRILKEPAREERGRSKSLTSDTYEDPRYCSGPTRGQSGKRASGRNGFRKIHVSQEDTSRNLAKLKHSQLLKKERMLKTTLQAFPTDIVREIFKELTGITTTHQKTQVSVLLPWPRPAGAPPRLNDMGGELLDPRFDADVLHLANRAIFNRNADLAVQSLIEDTPEIMIQLHNKIQVKRSLLLEFAKTTFRGYCTQYQAQTDEIKEKMGRANRKAARQRSRRLDVCFLVGFTMSKS
ncbi:hypothetical protein JB92DRAFT_2834487 [Gautieria morchelliformis]|nr:hypothetical protein JB92DRAFT_2834487 [Gautieria morchelliformis]